MPKTHRFCSAQIKASRDAYNILKDHWDMGLIQYLEQFKVMLLNKTNRVIGICDISQGGISATLVDIKVVFVVALKAGASAIVLSHNHPSGNPYDLSLTGKIQEAAKLFDISVYDHIVITPSDYYNYADNRLL